ncbi:hypothetical protein NIES25_69880 (plasmid) [Nostoc linckia NIES-25]|nr:hypothetical protein NIES25_69880 [Nostoc linckia NIES-25]
MPRNIRWDDSVKENTLYLVEALLRHADEKFEDEELKTVVYVEWITENKLRVTGKKVKQVSGKRSRTDEVGTRKEYLLDLVTKAGKTLKSPELKNKASTTLQDKLNEIQTALDCLKELGLREDEKSAKNQGYWKFKLTLKHQTATEEENLDAVRRSWREYSKTNLPQTSQKDVSPSSLLYRFQLLIADKTEGFVGRQYVFSEIADFIDNQPNGYFTIEADPGIGKSAILAKYVQDNNCIAHFNVRSGINSAADFLESVCQQFINRYNLPYPSLPPNATQDGRFLEGLLNEVSSKLGEGEKLVIAIDALDEVDLATQKDGTNILYLPPYLPQGVYFLLTRRRVTLPFVVHAPQYFLNLMEYKEQSRGDVQEYIRRVTERSKLLAWIDKQQMSVEEFINQLADKSENNFIYLRYVLPQIEQGFYQDLSITELPTGLEGYYEDHWRRMGMNAKPLPHTKLKIIYIMGEIHQPVSRSLISEYAEEKELTVQDVLNEWEQFLHKQLIEKQTCYSIYHASFLDFLHRKDIVQAAGVEIRKINAMIADVLWKGLFGDE